MGAGRGASTQALIGDYSSQFLGNGPGSRSSLRTPLQENIIMQEARNQRAFRDMTPLAGKYTSYHIISYHRLDYSATLGLYHL